MRENPNSKSQRDIHRMSGQLANVEALLAAQERVHRLSQIDTVSALHDMTYLDSSPIETQNNLAISSLHALVSLLRSPTVITQIDRKKELGRILEGVVVNVLESFLTISEFKELDNLIESRLEEVVLHKARFAQCQHLLQRGIRKGKRCARCIEDIGMDFCKQHRE